MDKLIHIDDKCELCDKPAVVYYGMITVPAPLGCIPLCLTCAFLFEKFAGKIKSL